MRSTGKCPKCGSTRIIADATPVDRGHYSSDETLSIATYQKPYAWIFKGKHSSNVSAFVCEECGFVELYAENPAAIKKPSD
jgi:predicted nucleic-acid-binding Zn-ribbon protein